MTPAKYFGVLFLAVLMLFASAVKMQAQAPSPVRQVAKLLICPCPDCGKQALDQCPDGCHEGKEHRDEIAALLKQNKSQDEILKFFATTYGAHMLGDPPREGFGALASWVPYSAIVFGLLPLFLIARSRRVRTSPSIAIKAKGRAGKSKAAATEDPRLAAALKDFDY